MAIGQSLKAIRQESAITIRELSRRSSLAHQTIRLIENGGGTLKSLDRILETLQYEIWWERKYDDMLVGPALARFRKAARINQKDFAKTIGISGQTIVDFERRSSGMVRTIEKYIRFFQINAVLRPSADANERPSIEIEA